MQVFKFIFSWVYRRQRSVYGSIESALVGILALSILVWINLKTLFMVLLHFNFIPGIPNSNLFAVISGLIVMIIIGVLVFKTDYYKRLDNTSVSKEDTIIKILAIGYIIFTFGIFFILVILTNI